jgi:hypothetical protein
MQADAHDRLVIPAAAPTLDRAEWGKDPGLESGFDPVLDRIQYLAESGLTSPGWAAEAGTAGHVAAPELPRAGQRELELEP